MTKGNMRNLIISSGLLVILACGASAADGSEWRVYSEEANGNIYYFDTSRVKRTSNLRTVWQRILYKTSVMGASSYESLLEVDCSERTERILQRTFFSDKQWENPAMSTDTRAKPKRPIAEGSAAERLSQILCDQ